MKYLLLILGAIQLSAASYSESATSNSGSQTSALVNYTLNQYPETFNGQVLDSIVITAYSQTQLNVQAQNLGPTPALETASNLTSVQFTVPGSTQFGSGVFVTELSDSWEVSEYSNAIEEVVSSYLEVSEDDLALFVGAGQFNIQADSFSVHSHDGPSILGPETYNHQFGVRVTFNYVDPAPEPEVCYDKKGKVVKCKKPKKCKSKKSK